MLSSRLKYLYNQKQKMLSLYNQHIGLQGINCIIWTNHNQMEGSEEVLNLQQLLQLYMANNDLDYRGIQVLITVQWRNLKVLSLCTSYLYQDKNNIGLRGIKYFVQGSWPTLQYLTLSNTNQTDQSIKILCKYNFTKIIGLIITDNFLGFQSLIWLKSCNLPNIQFMQLCCNSKISEVSSLWCACLMPVRKVAIYDTQQQVIRNSFRSLLEKLSTRCSLQAYCNF